MDESKSFSDPAMQEAWDRLVRINHRLLTEGKWWSPVEFGIATQSMAQAVGQAEADRLNARAQFIMDIGDAARLRLFR
jgi:hypothetical protein